MNMIVIAALLALSLTLQSAAAAPQNIQNANPLNVDLSDPSQAVNNAELDDPKFGGYRPLYPPYFLRDAPIASQHQHQPGNQPVYYDKEYYTRGRRLNEENLGGNARIVGTAAPRQQLPIIGPAVPVPATNAAPYGVLRAFANFDRRLKPKFAGGIGAGGGGPGSGSYAFASVFVNT